MGQEIVLYLDLEKGRYADLEVVARASLAFTALVKEIAFIADPSLEIRLEIESGTEGSLSINSIIKFLTTKIVDKKTRAAIAAAIAYWFLEQTGSSLWTHVIDNNLFGDQSLTEQDIAEITAKATELCNSKVGEKHAQTIYKELSKDEAVKGVGVAAKKSTIPSQVIPREQFLSRSATQTPQLRHEPRERKERMFLTLISPVLQENHNKWRFLSKDGMISAAVEDEQFIQKLVRGEINIQMKGGIMLTADISIKEEYIDNVWVIRERTLVRVVKIDAGDTQYDLLPEK